MLLNRGLLCLARPSSFWQHHLWTGGNWEAFHDLWCSPLEICLVHKSGCKLMILLKVNGIGRSFDGDPTMPVLWYLRDILGLTGTKFGCGMALCGGFTVHRNGEAVRSCVVPIQSVVGAEITTIEGIGSGGLHPIQNAWIELNLPQCGYCHSTAGHRGDNSGDVLRSRARRDIGTTRYSLKPCPVHASFSIPSNATAAARYR